MKTKFSGIKPLLLSVPLSVKIMGIVFGLIFLFGLLVVITMTHSLKVALGNDFAGLAPPVLKDLISSIVLVSLFSVVVSYFLVRIINAQVQELTNIAKAIQEGDVKKRVEVCSSDEMGKLGEAFNLMVDNLNQKNQERSQLLNKIIIAQEEERKRIARELHDGPGQSLSSLKIALKTFSPLAGTEEARRRIEQFNLALNSSLEEIHNLSVNLRPILLDDFGFFPAILEHIKKFENSSGLKVHYHLYGFAENCRFASLVEINIYRVIQEALSNVERHARATEVRVDFRKENSTFVAVIKDNGRGFTVPEEVRADRERKPLGILGMQERVLLLGGKFSISSRPGQGAKVELEVPV